MPKSAHSAPSQFPQKSPGSLRRVKVPYRRRTLPGSAASKLEANPTKAELDAAGCVLAKHAWDRDTVECGPNAPTPAQAAQILAQERWSLPEGLRKQKARLLR